MCQVASKESLSQTDSFIAAENGIKSLNAGLRASSLNHLEVNHSSTLGPAE